MIGAHAVCHADAARDRAATGVSTVSPAAPAAEVAQRRRPGRSTFSPPIPQCGSYDRTPVGGGHSATEPTPPRPS
jgi:hypothetical protein